MSINYLDYHRRPSIVSRKAIISCDGSYKYLCAYVFVLCGWRVSDSASKHILVHKIQLSSKLKKKIRKFSIRMM